MRKTWLVFVNSLQRMRLVLAVSVTLGVLLCVLTAVFSTIAPRVTGGIVVGYIDHDNSAVSSDFELYATQQLNMELMEGSQDYLDNQLVEKNISAIIEVPAGFEESILSGNSGALQVTYMDDYINRVFLQSYLEMYTSSVDMLAGAAQGSSEQLAVLLDLARTSAASITTVSLDEQLAQHYASWTVFLVGAGFFVFIAALLVITIATIIYEDKANNTFKRVQATNVNSLSYVVGVCLAGFISIIVMIAIYLVYCAATGMGELVNLVAVAVLSALFVLLCVGFALVCGLLFNSRNAILWSVLAISTICSLLGGVWFPLEYAPEIMQKLAHITPQFWFIDALYQMQDGVADAWIISSIVIALFTVLCFLIAGIRFSGTKSNAGA